MGLKGKLTKGSRCDYINALNVNISVKDSQHIKDGPVADKRRQNRRSSLSQEQGHDRVMTSTAMQRAHKFIYCHKEEGSCKDVNDQIK